jgi:uncharacterized protein
MSDGTAGQQAAPVTGAERHLSMDVVRGMALFGILIMNIMGFGYHLSPGEFTGTEPWSGANFWAWYIMQTFFEGTQRGLFSVLFGAGVILLTSRLEARGSGLSTADVYYRRNIWLIAWGMVNSYLLLWNGDILYYYGIAALFLYPARNVKPLNLAIAGLVCLSILFAQSLYDRADTLEQYGKYEAAVAVRDAGEDLDDEQQGAIDGWKKGKAEYYADEDKIQERLDAHRNGYSKTFMRHLPDLTDMHGNIAYRFLVLDALGFMLIGMALFKWGVVTLQAPARVYWLLLLIGYGVGVPLRVYTTGHIIESDWAMLSWTDYQLTYEVRRLFMTAGHLGLLLLFVRSGILAWLQNAIAAVGRMALTNYIMHSVLALIIFLRPGFGLYGAFERHELYYVVAGICLFQLIVSPIWLKYYRFGPLEWVWRSLTYMKRPPLRRRPGDVGLPPV